MSHTSRDDWADPCRALKLDVEAHSVILNEDLASAKQLLIERLITLSTAIRPLTAMEPEHLIRSLPTSMSMLAGYDCSANSRL